jgi:hypothetical protein
VRGELLSVSNDLVGSVGTRSQTPVEDRNHVTQPEQVARRVAADKPGCADEEDSHDGA